MRYNYSDTFLEPTKAQEYEQRYSNHSYDEILWSIEQCQLLDLLREFRETHPHIKYLDFAVGTGRIISVIEKHVDSAVGIDISPAMVEIAQKKVQRSRIICADITQAIAPCKEQYDFITAFRFFLNANTNLRCTVMKKLSALLRDHSSRLIFNNHGNLWSHKLGMWPIHAVHRMGGKRKNRVNYMTLRQGKRLAEEAGLVIEKVMGCGLLSTKARWMLSFDLLLDIESRLAKTAFFRYFGVNQMYVARLKV